MARNVSRLPRSLKQGLAVRKVLFELVLSANNARHPGGIPTMATAATKFRIDRKHSQSASGFKWPKAARSRAEGSHSSRAGIPAISGETQCRRTGIPGGRKPQMGRETDLPRHLRLLASFLAAAGLVGCVF